MPEYAERYLDELLRCVAKEAPFEASRVIGEVSATNAKQPHLAIFVELGPTRYLGTTAGLSARPMPLPVKAGFQYFELCAFTDFDSPAILWLLSNLGSTMLGSLSPLFYGDEESRRNLIETIGETGSSPEPAPFMPFQTVVMGDAGDRVLLVPRFRFFVPKGPPVEVVEPLPISLEDWGSLSTMTNDERSAWVSSLGALSALQWKSFLARTPL